VRARADLLEQGQGGPLVVGWHPADARAPGRAGAVVHK
jgi:hypothetical protein